MKQANKWKKRGSDNQRGFSLISTVFAMAIAMTTSLALSQMLVQAQKLQTHQRNNQDFSEIKQHLMGLTQTKEACEMSFNLVGMDLNESQPLYTSGITVRFPDGNPLLVQDQVYSGWKLISSTVTSAESVSNCDVNAGPCYFSLAIEFTVQNVAENTQKVIESRLMVKTEKGDPATSKTITACGRSVATIVGSSELGILNVPMRVRITSVDWWGNSESCHGKLMGQIDGVWQNIIPQNNCTGENCPRSFTHSEINMLNCHGDLIQFFMGTMRENVLNRVENLSGLNIVSGFTSEYTHLFQATPLSGSWNSNANPIAGNYIHADLLAINDLIANAQAQTGAGCSGPSTNFGLHYAECPHNGTFDWDFLFIDDGD